MSRTLTQFLRQDLAEMAPPNSYIHVEDYDSPAELVKYIDYLHKNDTAYLEYHKWKDVDVTDPKDVLQFSSEAKYSTMSCDLCKNLTQRKENGWAKKMIKSVASWWWRDVHDDKCTSAYKVPKWQKNIPIVKMNETYDEMKNL